MDTRFHYRFLTAFVIGLVLSSLPANGQTVIVIDPGHAFTDDPNLGVNTGSCPNPVLLNYNWTDSNGNIRTIAYSPDCRTITEIETALDVGLRMKAYLESFCDDIEVYLTRTTNVLEIGMLTGDPDIDIYPDAPWMNVTQHAVYAGDKNADAFISIHCNAGGGHGTETYYCDRFQNGPNSHVALDFALAEDINLGIGQTGMTQPNGTLRHGGAPREFHDVFGFHLGVLRYNPTPNKCLNELGFVDTPSDVEKLTDPAFRQMFAESYANVMVARLGIQSDCNQNPCVDNIQNGIDGITAWPRAGFTLLPGQEGELSVGVTGGHPPYSFFWSGEDVLCRSCPVTQAFPTHSQTYEVLVTDATDCYATATIGIEVPDGSCPNGYNFACLNANIAPVNDCSQPSGLQNYIPLNNNCATTSTTPPLVNCLGDQSENDIWFATYAGVNGNLIIDSDDGTVNDLEMALYTGEDCFDLTFLGCYPNGSGNDPNGWMPRASLTGLTPGEPVFIRMWDFGFYHQGTFSLCIEDPDLMDDDCDTSPLVVTETVTPVSCGISGDGEVSLQVSGGAPPYRYNWRNYGTDNALTNLITSGYYLCTITDNRGCRVIFEATVPMLDTVPPTCVLPTQVQTSIIASDLPAITLMYNQIDGGSFDACGMEPFQGSIVLDDYVLGNNPVEYVLSDVNGNSTTCTSSINIHRYFTVTPKVLLEGAFNPLNTGTSNRMYTILNDGGFITTGQPFNTNPWNYNGTESFASVEDMPDDMVDWVLVRYKDAADPSQLKWWYAGVLHADGSITEVDGGNHQYLLDSSEGVYLEIDHLSHLSIITPQPLIPGTSNFLTHDFTTSPTSAYQNPILDDNPLKEMPSATGSYYAMHAGNVQNIDCQIDINDFNAIFTVYGLSNYYGTGDVIMDGLVDFNDFNLLFANFNVNCHKPY